MEMTLTAETDEASGGKRHRRTSGKRRRSPIFPPSRNVPAYMALAALVGLVVGVGLAFFIEYLDTSVKTLDDVERYLQIPVLAVIPKNVSILMKNVGRFARRGSLPHPARRRRIQQTVPRREHLHADQRRPRRRQIHDAEQPRLHLRQGRLQRARRRCRLAPGDAAPVLRHGQQLRPHRLPARPRRSR